MSPILIVHICAGTVAVLSGAGALCSGKGGQLHRWFGTLFLISMLSMGALGAYLANLLPQHATVAVAILTGYLVTTGWAAARNKTCAVKLIERILIAVPLIVATYLVAGGVQAVRSRSGTLEGVPYLAYFIFAIFALVTAFGDLRMIMRGSMSGVQRIARHLWRMCFALLFAVNIFFGQEKVLPKSVHDSAFLLIPALAPLAIMIYWLLRVRFPTWFKTRVQRNAILP